MHSVAIVPIKLTNERLPGKNLLPLPDGSTLLTRVLATLRRVRGLDATYVFCSDRSIQALAEAAGAHFLERDPELDLATATSNDILQAFANKVMSDVYVLAHATSPFLSEQSVERGLAAIGNDGFDSAFAVTRQQTFYWTEGKPANYDPARIARTQDLEPVFLETSGFYAFERDVLVDLGRRIGPRSAMIEVSKLEALDVDDPEDFELVSALAAYRADTTD